jgi:hypothetical protein
VVPLSARMKGRDSSGRLSTKPLALSVRPCCTSTTPLRAPCTRRRQHNNITACQASFKETELRITQFIMAMFHTNKTKSDCRGWGNGMKRMRSRWAGDSGGWG